MLIVVGVAAQPAIPIAQLCGTEKADNCARDTLLADQVRTLR
jgi:hypothetical protein